MDKLKYVKIENDDGSLSENIPIGVDAKNVDVNIAGGSENLQTNLESKQTQIDSLKTQTQTNTTSIAANASAINTQKTRIDNLATLEEGSTTGDAELIDIRTGYDGTNYINAGGAVRGQARNDYGGKILLEQGFITLTGRINLTMNQWYHTKNYFPITNIASINIPLWKGGSMIAYYDKNYCFISGIEGTGQAPTTGEYFTSFEDAPDNAIYIRISIQRSDVSKLTESYLSFNNSNFQYNLGALGENISEISKYLELNSSDRYNILDLQLDNKVLYSIMEDGTSKSYGGWGTTRSILLNRDKYLYVTVRAFYFKDRTIYIPPASFWTANSQFIEFDWTGYLEKGYNINATPTGPSSSNHIVTLTVPIPKNATYIRITCATRQSFDNTHLICVKDAPHYPMVIEHTNKNLYTGSDFAFEDGTTVRAHLQKLQDEIDNIEIPEVNEWKNKTCVFLGDSITQGVGTTKAYWSYLKDFLNIDEHSYGVNGAQSSAIVNQLNNATNALGADNIDAIFVFFGTNDFNGGVPIGDWFTETTEDVVINSSTGATATRKKRNFTTGSSTFKARLNTGLSAIKNQYPKAQVILMTPIHRAYATFGATNIQYNELYANSIDVYFEEYIKAVREAADIYSIYLIDLYRDCGLYPLDSNYSQYFNNANTDMLHPNAKGHYRIAQTIAKALSKIPSQVIN